MLLPYTTNNGVVHKKTIVGKNGLLCREGTYDLEVSKEIHKCYSTLPVNGLVVLDIGGNIGGFARYAAMNGAKQVISIEPEESNFKCLQKNTEGLPVVCVRACLDRENGVTKIYLSTGTNPGNTTQTPRRGRYEQTVDKVSITEILHKYKPQSVKIDCEGAEYNIGFASIWPDFVKNVCGEIHISGFGFEKANQFAIGYSNWRTVIAPKITQTSWHTIFSYSRN